MKEIKIEGFTSNIQADDALAIALHGEQGSGKTRFMVTAPDPIGVIPLDRKTRSTVKRIAADLNKTVFMPKEDFIRVDNPMKLAMLPPYCNKQKEVKLEQKAPDMCCAIHYYRWHVNRIKAAAFRLYDSPDIRTIGIDTGTQLWEDMLFAHFGRAERIMPRDRGAVNQEMIEFLNCLSGKHLVINHKSKEVWRNDKPTGKHELAGFPHMGYHVNVIAEMVCDENKAEGDDDRFTMNVSMCQDNPAIQGPGGKKLLSDDAISFPYLATQIYPDIDISEWV